MKVKKCISFDALKFMVIYNPDDIIETQQVLNNYELCNIIHHAEKNNGETEVLCLKGYIANVKTQDLIKGDHVPMDVDMDLDVQTVIIEEYEDDKKDT